MKFIIRSTSGIILSNEEQETVFHTKAEAQDQLDFLTLHTTEEWQLVPLAEHHHPNQKG